MGWGEERRGMRRGWKRERKERWRGNRKGRERKGMGWLGYRMEGEGRDEKE